MSNTESFKALERAYDAIGAAKYDLEGGHVLAAANRSYYAMFYCMTALLYTKDVFAKTHQGVQSKFNELFIKTGLIETYVGKYVQQASALRQNADYDLNVNIEADQVKSMLDNAIDFYQHTKRYLEEIWSTNHSSRFPSYDNECN